MATNFIAMKDISVSHARLIDIPKIASEEGLGNLSVVEKDLIPFAIKRVYYLYDVPSNATRGGHAHKQLQQFLVAVSGSFDVVLDDGNIRKTVHLNRPYIGLYIPNGLWRELENFSSGAVCVSMVSDNYEEEDYIRNFEEFKLTKGGNLNL
ncbi:MAG: FdtA/QdtA family cupin domain-containing protein [Flavobacteriaceae bacterium]